ncbi:ABC transporter transmembrane domain-containing protein, partial [Synechococcus sp. CB0205]|uniref:ABC transporter transmembrane domain-containing protein n=1 Tax=Synechococcus sp. CB0205 TaxID=232363 RepID=UPI0012EA3F3A
MSEASFEILRHVEPFHLLSDEQRTLLEKGASVLKYKVGQLISDSGVLSNQVVLILQGRARLVFTVSGLPQTLGNLEPGALVGLASLLRGHPCETVSASSELIALSISDELFLSIYQESAKLASWCSNRLFPAELAALTECLFEKSQRSDLAFVGCFKAIREQAQPAASLQSVGSLDRSTFVASVNSSDLAIGTILQAGQSAPERRGPIPIRLISLPNSLANSILQLPASSSSTTFDSTEPQPEPLAAPITTLAANAVPSSYLTPTRLDVGQSGLPRDSDLVRGEGLIAEGMACFQMLCSDLGVPFRRDAVEKILRDVQRRGTQPDLQLYGGLAGMLGLHVSGVLIKPELAPRLPVPAILPWHDGFALLRRSGADGLLLASPREGWVTVTMEEIRQLYPEGIPVLQLEKTNSTPEQRFGFSWFLPALRKYRSAFLQVLFASFVVQLFSLANPLLIQVIIDKVITQRSLDTLQVLGFALVVVTILESVLGGLRTFLLTETTNRIDTRLGAEVIDHLLRLPLLYFDKRPVGELGSRVSELEKIRNFLTGQGLTTLLDACFSVIYIVVMVSYSWLLTLVALAVLPIQVLLILIGTPLFRRQTRDVTQENARTQSHLVEVLTGIQTVKAQNVEMVSRWKWQERYTGYISRAFEKTLTATALNQTTNVLQKLSQLLVLWVGAALVLQSQISLGQLIAFRIISGYVTQPLLRLSSIWQSLQEIRISFER